MTNFLHTLLVFLSKKRLAEVLKHRQKDISYFRQLERQRIMKLLEDSWVEPMDWLSVEALIKGEQK